MEFGFRHSRKVYHSRTSVQKRLQLLDLSFFLQTEEFFDLFRLRHDGKEHIVIMDKEEYEVELHEWLVKYFEGTDETS